LPDQLTVDQLKTNHPSIPYNPDIATTFFRAGLIEAWGRGTLKIIEECQKTGIPSPEFSSDSGGLGIEFRRSSGKMSGKMSGKILALVREDKFVTIPELSKNIGVTERTIERNLKKLQQEKRLNKVGGAKGGYWEVMEGWKSTVWSSPSGSTFKQTKSFT
jgi:ATP-dependent DNA helicase RecG